MRHFQHTCLSILICLVLGACGGSGGAGVPSPTPVPVPVANPAPAPIAVPVAPPVASSTSFPILYVTQTPVSGFASRTTTFGNHLASAQAVPRGGDLMVRYPDGSVRNLTAEAGFGTSGFQGANSIAVREPSVHWSGTKALFSMVVGSPATQYEVRQFQ